MLSIVIPTLNAGGSLAATLACLAGGQNHLPHEVIVVDGGSIDDTAVAARCGGAILIEAPRGRGRQLAAGAAAASGEWYLFLHADTRLSDSWSEAVRKFTANGGNVGRAAFFRFALDDRGTAARVVEALVRVRCRWLGLPYGDQGLLISRALYEQLGGYKAIPLMEDVDLVRRIGRSRLTGLKARAVTSATKYRQDGYMIRPLRNLVCLGLYAVGVPPRHIAYFYR